MTPKLLSFNSHNICLTNKEASTVLCSVVKHTGREQKKCRGKHLSTSCVLYNRTEQSRGFLICFIIENPIFSHQSAEFSNQTSSVIMLCSPIKHTKISQSQSLLELFK